MTHIQPDSRSRRWFGRAVLLGGAGAGVAAVARPEPAAAGPATTAWQFGGNSTVATNGTNFLGPTNVAPLIFKTSATAGNPVEAGRFTPGGALVLRKNAAINAAPASDARLNIVADNVSGTAITAAGPNSISTALASIGVKSTATVGVQGNGEYMGVVGSSLNYGIFGYTVPDTGGMGAYGRGAIGVKGRSYHGQAVLGDTDDGVGVKGESYSDGSSVKAVHGEAFGASSNGVVGTANNGASAYGVWGISSTGYAGVFSGKVVVTGSLSKGGGSFKIDHPLDPRHKYLYHSFVESPDMMNVYNGNVVTDGRGRATVELPGYFMALNKDFRYQLTVVGQFAQAIVGREIADGSFDIHTDRPRVKVSWQVTGIRQDAWAEAHRIPVEEAKTGSERGLLLHPVEHGAPAADGVDHARLRAVASSGVRTPDPVPAR